MEKLNMQTTDVVDENIKRIEKSRDFDPLKMADVIIMNEIKTL